MTNGVGAGGFAKKKDCVRCKTPMGATVSTCPKCGAFQPVQSATPIAHGGSKLIALKDVDADKTPRIPVGYLDNVFGRNSKPGLPVANILMGGPPGGGKSTLILQIAEMVSAFTKKTSVIVAREEDCPPIRERADRVGCKQLGLIKVHPIGADTDPVDEIENEKPGLVIVDSISKFCGSADQQVTMAENCKGLVVKLQCPFILVSHVTKQLDFAGLQKLQHEVDICLLIGPCEHPAFKQMRAIDVEKNRFGEAQFSTYVRMLKSGLQFFPEDQPEEDEGEGFDDVEESA